MITTLKKIRNRLILWKNRHYMTAGANFTCGQGTRFWAKDTIEIGDNCYFGRYCCIESDLKMGNQGLVANQVAMVGKLDHDLSVVETPIRSAPEIRDPGYNPPLGQRLITVGDDVWIGYGTIILSGVTIGHGAIIAAGSLVTKDIPPFEIHAGAPTRKIRDRFDSESDLQRHIRCCQEQYNCFVDL